MAAAPLHQRHHKITRVEESNNLLHLRVAEGGGIALHLKPEIIVVDAARHIDSQNQLQGAFLLGRLRKTGWFIARE
jgi:hypothetical protein